MSSLKDRVKSLQADTTNTDTALTTLEEALAEKVSMASLRTLPSKGPSTNNLFTVGFSMCFLDCADKTSLMQCRSDVLGL